MTLSKDIKEYALYLGYTKAGITTAENFDDYLEKLHARKNYDFITKSPAPLTVAKAAHPKDIMPEGRSIIVLAYDYKQKYIPHLEKAMLKNDPYLSEYAAWALKKLKAKTP